MRMFALGMPGSIGAGGVLPGRHGRARTPVGRGGMQFVLVIWLQGIWLPLHGYDYGDTPLWAGIFMLPLTAGLRQQGVPAHVAIQAGSLPPVSSLFAAQLGVNPVQQLLQPSGTLTHLTAAQQQTLTGREFFPHLISGPFHSGLVVVFAFGATLAFLAALASLLRGTSTTAKTPGPRTAGTTPAAATDRTQTTRTQNTPKPRSR